MRGELRYQLPPKGLAVPEFTHVDEGVRNAVPYGTGLAFLVDEAEELVNGLWLRIEVRDGRPQLVTIESRESEHQITSTSLRFPVREVVRSIIRDATVRLERDPETGETVGVRAASPTGAGETRTVAERTRDVELAAATGKRGRPRLTDDFLREVATKWDNAQKGERGASYELADLYGVEPSTVRQWMFKARNRGLARKETTDG